MLFKFRVRSHGALIPLLVAAIQCYADQVQLRTSLLLVKNRRHLLVEYHDVVIIYPLIR